MLVILAQGPFCIGVDKEPESRVDVAFRAKVGFLDVAQPEGWGDSGWMNGYCVF